MINNYSEKEIRNRIISKVNPVIKKGRSKHDKGKIYIDEKHITTVKIPNDHSKIMKQSKSQYIASSLKLSHEEFNDLIDCPLTGSRYYEKLKDEFKQN